MTIESTSVARTTPQPWRNGGGTTRELLTWPSAQAFGIRVSVADVVRDGPFSAFDGIDRWFAVLEGAGVELRFRDDDGTARRVVPGDAPIAFDGARPVHCVLLGGATVDLNVMVVRARGDGYCIAAPNDPPGHATDLRAVFVQQSARLEHAGGTLDLAPMTLAWSTHASRATWRLATAGRAWWIGYHAKGKR